MHKNSPKKNENQELKLSKSIKNKENLCQNKIENAKLDFMSQYSKYLKKSKPQKIKNASFTLTKNSQNIFKNKRKSYSNLSKSFTKNNTSKFMKNPRKSIEPIIKNEKNSILNEFQKYLKKSKLITQNNKIIKKTQKPIPTNCTRCRDLLHKGLSTKNCPIHSQKIKLY